MASGCVKSVGTSSSYAWTSSKMSSLNRESEPLDRRFDENQDPVDFEFLLEDPVTMLSADELFSNGKLVPLKFSGATNSEEKTTTAPDTVAKPCRKLEMEISSAVDPYLFSPRAPRCTVRWRELLGLKRLNKTQEETPSPSSSTSRLSSSSPNPKTASFRHFLNRSSKPTSKTPSPSPPPPLSTKDSDVSELSSSISSSRLSLSSSSSSGHELDDVPRLSLDLDKPGIPNPFARSRAHHHHLRNQRKPRHHHHHHSPADETTESESRGLTVTADSPRLNASGKLVFHGLERSSSSPGNFTGGPRMKHHHGMPRSYSANVRITPVLNVPVSSLRGGPKSGLFFGQLFSSSSSSSGNRVAPPRTVPTEPELNRTQNVKNRTGL